MEEAAGSKDRGGPPQEVTSHDRHNEQRRLAGGGTGRFGSQACGAQTDVQCRRAA
jgi:hypothetical protein